MSEAVASVPERTTWAEIRSRCEGEWVLLVDVDWIDDIDFEPRTAVVVAHSPHRRDTISRVRDLPNKIEFAHFYIPKPGE